MYRDRQRKQKIVVLRKVKPGVGIENAAEYSHGNRYQSEQSEIQPTKTRIGHGLTDAYGKSREHSADNENHKSGIKYY